jgi:hypothetical protein
VIAVLTFVAQAVATLGGGVLLLMFGIAIVEFVVEALP